MLVSLLLALSLGFTGCDLLQSAFGSKTGSSVTGVSEDHERPAASQTKVSEEPKPPSQIATPAPVHQTVETRTTAAPVKGAEKLAARTAAAPAPRATEQTPAPNHSPSKSAASSAKSATGPAGESVGPGSTPAPTLLVFKGSNRPARTRSASQNGLAWVGLGLALCSVGAGGFMWFKHHPRSKAAAIPAPKKEELIDASGHIVKEPLALRPEPTTALSAEPPVGS